MKTFDWNYIMNLTHNPTKIEWLKSVQNKKISEQEFVKNWSAFPRFGRHPYKKYSPSSSKKKYYKLKKDFGFF